PPRVPAGAKTPPMGSASVAKPPAQPAPAKPAPPATPAPPRQAVATPPAATPVAPPPRPTPPPPQPAPKPPAEGRSTAAWASEPVKPPVSTANSGPYVGNFAAIPDEPAFAGRFHSTADPEAQFKTSKVIRPDVDDEDDLLPSRRGTRAGLWIVLALLAFGGAAAAGVYMFVIKDSDKGRAGAGPDPGSAEPPDAAVVAAAPDAPEAPPVSPVDTAQSELAADNEVRLRTAFESLAGKDEPAAQAVRAHLAAAIAQALTDRAGVLADRAEADKLRRQADAIVIEAATSAQRALATVPDDAAANLAMAAVLRLQRKPAAAIKRYSDAAKTKGDRAWARDIALADALLLARDGKLDEARAALAAIDLVVGKLEGTSDVRARFQLARIALAQGRPADARPLVEQILAVPPEHAGARALAAKLETAVATTDPLPPEEPKQGAGEGATRPPDRPGPGPGPGPTGPGPGPGPTPVVAGGSYDTLLKRADGLAERDCAGAMALYQKALEQKPNGVEALTGMGYCHIDQKQFSSAFGKFRAALAVSSRYEPALWGVAEAYQQQGRKEDAIAAFQRYLEAYPGSPKALRQLERLGASPGGGSPSGGAAGSTPAPAPAPTPAPAAGEPAPAADSD
ncbi:MAG TPA: tetratricopeptide repeat protein, partial [Kofleriaceae bacterium]|nr:tetratricopeptide repeat protein [Kofleriaceae bacterium]